MPDETLCPRCHGDGLDFESDEDVQSDCPRCDGSGRILVEDLEGDEAV